MTFLKMQDLDLKNKRLLIRADLNVPMQASKITNDARLKAVLPTLRLALEQQASILLISHLGRPKEGETNLEFSLKSVAERLSQLLNIPIRFEPHWLEGINIAPGEIVLGENVRFLQGEEENDPVLAQKMAKLCDVFIMDAFATAHRAQASTVGVAHYARDAAAGLLVTQELNALDKIFANPKHPVVAIVGGAKVSSKLLILKSLLKHVDILIVGGGIANTFIKSLGYSIGTSLYEKEFVEAARELLKASGKQNKLILMPQDVVVSKEISSTATTEIKKISDISQDDKILDVGPLSLQQYVDYILEAKTVLWNGPVGVFEMDPFASGTKAIAEAIADSEAFSVAGGGETLAAIDKFKITDKISYISTAGGAFLEYLEGKTLPAIAALEKREYT